MIIVDDMVSKYSQGESHLQKCPICDYEEELKTSGVHVTEGGGVIVHSADDEFSCPNCSMEKNDQPTAEVFGMSCRCNAPYHLTGPPREGGGQGGNLQQAPTSRGS